MVYPEQKSNDIIIISVEKLDNGVIRTWLRIKGHLFKRLYSEQYNYPLWSDEELTFSECLAMTNEQEKELESIFQTLKL